MNNFLIDNVMQGAMSLRILYLTGLGAIVYYFAYHITCAVNIYKAKGKFWTKEDSAYYREDGTLDRRLIFLVFGRFACTFFLILQIYGVFYTSIASGISTAIITSLFAANVLTTSLAFLLIYDEKLGVRHYIGMICIIISIVLIAYGKDAEKESLNLSTTEQTMSIWYPILLSFLGCLIFTTQSIISRAVRTTKISSPQYTADSMFPTYLILTICGIHQHFAVSPYLLSEFMYQLGISTCWILGVICLNGAITYGKGGPVQALC